MLLSIPLFSPVALLRHTVKANVSNIVQIVLAILSGSIFALFYHSRVKLRIDEDSLAKLQDGFLDSSVQLTIAIANEATVTSSNQLH